MSLFFKLLITGVIFMAGSSAKAGIVVTLPKPSLDSTHSIEKAISNRRSVRNFSYGAVTLKDVSQILWAAQGITGKKKGYRAAPSAGASYPLMVYVVVGNVEGLSEGIYRYDPKKHELIQTGRKDVRKDLSSASFGQSCVAEGSVVIVFSAVYNRVTNRYGKRGVRYVDMEAGHASENIYLQAESLGLSTVAVGAFTDKEVKKIIGMPFEETPLYIMPIGKVE